MGIEKIKKEMYNCPELSKSCVVLAFPKENETKIKKPQSSYLGKKDYICSCHHWAEIVPMVIRSLFNQGNGTVKTPGIAQRRH